MGNMNVVVVEGNLTKAAELSRWSDGTPWAKFTVANNESYKGDDGQWHDIPSFIDCTMRGNYAEAMARHLLKGRHVTVSGRLKQQTWTADDGQKKSRLVVKVQELSLSPVAPGGKDGAWERGGQPPPGAQGAWQHGDGAGGGYDPAMFDGTMQDFGDEIPF